MEGESVSGYISGRKHSQKVRDKILKWVSHMAIGEFYSLAEISHLIEKELGRIVIAGGEDFDRHLRLAMEHGFIERAGEYRRGARSYCRRVI